MRYKPERALTHLCTVQYMKIRVYVEMRYKPERALTLSSSLMVEMRYKPERALTLTKHNKGCSICSIVEMRYKSDHIGARPCVQLRACNPTCGNHVK